MKSRGMIKNWCLAAVLAGGVTACGDDAGPTGSIFPERPECEGADVVALAGDHRMVVARLNLAEPDEGFDLDGDGLPDNKLGPLKGLAGGPITDAFNEFTIVIPLEIFDFPTTGPDACVKFAFYLGEYTLDRDGDGEKTAKDGGDCDDTDATVKHGVTELAENGQDDDCDGLTDEAVDDTPSASAADTDGDGTTVAMGDCDDNDAMVKPGGLELCGDGKDNDCTAGADFSPVAAGAPPACTPFDSTGTPDEVVLDPLSFDATGAPVIEFNSAETRTVDGELQLSGGPSLFSVVLPLGIIDLDLRITGATLVATVATVGGGLGLTGGRLGGVLDGPTLDTIRGLDVSEIGLGPEDSLLDAIFTSPLLGVLVVLPEIDTDGDGENDCTTPDIDVDRDGLEGFCDADLDGDPDTHKVDTCIDGDGTVFHDGDEGSVHCTEILGIDGKHRFVDGVSVALTFDTVPVSLTRE